MNFKNLFKSKTKLREQNDLKLLYQITCINKYQSTLINSINDGDLISSLQVRHIEDYILNQLPKELKQAKEHTTPGLHSFVEKRLTDFSRLYAVISFYDQFKE